VSLSRTVFDSEFQTAGAVQRNARFAIVVLVNGRHSAGVALSTAWLYNGCLKSMNELANWLVNYDDSILNLLNYVRPIRKQIDLIGLGDKCVKTIKVCQCF